MPTTSKATAKKTAAVAKKTTPRRKTPLLTEEQRAAKFEAYQAMKLADLPIPKELAEVEGWIAEIQAQRETQNEAIAQEAKQEAAQIAKENKKGPWYVRNCYPAPFNLRLDRQTEKRRLELKPRGKPGDMHPLKEEDLKDPVLRQNLNLGVIEVIPAGEAQIISDKQTTNLSRRVHTPIAVLTNEYGKPYEAENPVKVEAEFNRQGVTVAQIDPRLATGELTDKEVARSGGITRTHSGFVPTGGNPAIIQYGQTGDVNARIADDIARRKDISGPAAGLGGVQVVVEPVRRT